MRRLAGVAAALLVTGCGGGGDRLSVFAASSLTEAFQALDPDADFTFAGSDTLARQLRDGAPADVYAAADPRYALDLFRAGLVERPRILAANQVVLIVPRSNPARIESLSDLRPGIRLVIGARGVPIGDYTRTALERSGSGRAALRNVVSEEPDVKSVVAKVALREADAGFAYASDVRAAGGKVHAVYPAIANPVYAIAIVRESNRREGAQAFVELTLGDRGQRELLAAGFVTTSRRGDPLG